MYNNPITEKLHSSSVLSDEFYQEKHYESYYRSIYGNRYHLCDQTCVHYVPHFPGILSGVIRKMPHIIFFTVNDLRSQIYYTANINTICICRY